MQKIHWPEKVHYHPDDNTIFQTAGSSSSAAAAASPLPSADAGEEEHTGQVDMKVMIVVCR